MATPKRKSQPQPTPKIHATDKQQASSEIISANWSGPLPPPGALRQFSEIIENGAERIMTLVEDEQKHRHGCEKAALTAEIVDSLGGKVLGAVMTLASIGGAIYAAHIGAHWSVSVAIVGVPITALIGKFIKSK